MPVDCPVMLRPTRQHQSDEIAELLELSGGGMRFVSQRAHATGERLQATVQPTYPVTPPLEALISVVRCEAVNAGFDIAASIDLMAPPISPDE